MAYRRAIMKRRRSGRMVRRRPFRNNRGLLRAKLYRLKTGCKPEIKMKTVFFEGNILTDEAISTALGVNKYWRLTNQTGNVIWPGQGTTDTDRLGDQIAIKKIWIQLHLEDGGNNNDQKKYRIILFSMYDKNDGVQAQLDQFWKHSNIFHNAILNNPEHEKYNIHYDRIIRSSIESYNGQVTQCSTININVSGRRLTKMKGGRCVFTKNTTVPKNNLVNLYLAVIAYAPTVTANDTVCGFVNGKTTLYYGDE